MSRWLTQPEKLAEQAGKVVTDMRRAQNADDIFDGFIALAKLSYEIGQIKTARKDENRRKSARERYALNKKLGRVRKPKVKAQEEYYDSPEECYCAATPRPPCGWCVNTFSEDD